MELETSYIFVLVVKRYFAPTAEGHVRAVHKAERRSNALARCFMCLYGRTRRARNVAMEFLRGKIGVRELGFLMLVTEQLALLVSV